MVERHPSLRSLEIFVHAARHLSFGKAAAKVNLSPSAVSRRIRALEKELGAALFVRRSKSVELTTVGTQYFASLSPAFLTIHQATNALTDNNTQKRLLLTVPQSFAVSWLTPRLPSFQKRCPDVEIEVNVSADITGHHADDFDVGVFLSQGSWPGRYVEKIMPISVFPVCSPDLARDIHTISDLAEQTLLHVRQLPNAWPEWLGAVGATNAWVKNKRTKQMHFNDVQLAYEAAQRGLGVAVGADIVVRGHLEAGRLVAPFEQKVPSAFSYYFVCTKTRLRDPVVQKFRRWLKMAVRDTENTEVR